MGFFNALLYSSLLVKKSIPTKTTEVHRALLHVLLGRIGAIKPHSQSNIAEKQWVFIARQPYLIDYFISPCILSMYTVFSFWHYPLALASVSFTLIIRLLLSYGGAWTPPNRDIVWLKRLLDFTSFNKGLRAGPTTINPHSLIWCGSISLIVSSW